MINRLVFKLFSGPPEQSRKRVYRETATGNEVRNGVISSGAIYMV